MGIGSVVMLIQIYSVTLNLLINQSQQMLDRKNIICPINHIPQNYFVFSTKKDSIINNPNPLPIINSLDFQHCNHITSPDSQERLSERTSTVDSFDLASPSPSVHPKSLDFLTGLEDDVVPCWHTNRVLQCYPDAIRSRL